MTENTTVSDTNTSTPMTGPTTPSRDHAEGNPLSTNNTVHPPSATPPTAQSTAVPTLAAWCADMFGRFVAWMRERTDRDLNGAQAITLALGALLGAGGALVVGAWLTYQLLHLLEWLVDGHAGAELLHALPVAHVALDPITTWADHHAAGLPVAPTALLTVWGIGGAVLALASLAGSRSARITWPLYGAATAAMAWFGATEPHRAIAAGLIALAWALASIVVLHRVGPRHTGRPITTLLPARHREPVPPQTGQPPAVPTPHAPVQ